MILMIGWLISGTIGQAAPFASPYARSTMCAWVLPVAGACICSAARNSQTTCGYASNAEIPDVAM